MEPLTFQGLRVANLDRNKSWHKNGLHDWSLSDWGVATAGELGEALNVVKKLNRVRDGIVGNNKTPDELRAQLAEELADTMIYLDLLAARADIDLAVAVAKKFNATSLKNGFGEMLPDEG